MARHGRCLSSHMQFQCARRSNHGWCSVWGGAGSGWHILPVAWGFGVAVSGCGSRATCGTLAHACRRALDRAGRHDTRLCTSGAIAWAPEPVFLWGCGKPQFQPRPPRDYWPDTPPGSDGAGSMGGRASGRERGSGTCADVRGVWRLRSAGNGADRQTQTAPDRARAMASAAVSQPHCGTGLATTGRLAALGRMRGRGSVGGGTPHSGRRDYLAAFPALSMLQGSGCRFSA